MSVPFIKYHASTAANYTHLKRNYGSRPDYPATSIKAFITDLELTSSTHVVDFGAGNGLLTKALLNELYPGTDGVTLKDTNFCAVEAASGMRDKFSKKFPGILLISGMAEHIGLQNACADVVVVGTAFHLFDSKTALKHISRILTPQGRLGLIWNLIDPDEPWVHDIRQLLAPYEKEKNHDDFEWIKGFEGDSPFTNPRNMHKTDHCTIKRTKEEVIGIFLSFRAVDNMNSVQVEQFKKDARRILDTNSATKGKEMIDAPYRVEMYVCKKKSISKLGSLDTEQFTKHFITRTPSTPHPIAGNESATMPTD